MLGWGLNEQMDTACADAMLGGNKPLLPCFGVRGHGGVVSFLVPAVSVATFRFGISSETDRTNAL